MLVLFTAIEGILQPVGSDSCADARAAFDLLTDRGVPVVLMSHGDAAAVKALQRNLGLRGPFICDGGASLYIPRGYFEELDGLSSGDDEWEVFEFRVRDPTCAVRLLTSLFAVRDEEVFTIGFGCAWADRMLLAAVTVPVIVRNDLYDQVRLLRRVPGAYLTAATGPAGWSEAVLGSAAV
jgi:hypothetical protein